MTVLNAFKAPRAQRLAGYGLEVPDLLVAQSFYGAFGLKADLNPADSKTLRMSTQHGGPAELALVAGPTKRLHHLSFAVRPEDLSQFEEHLHKIGTPATAAPHCALRAGLWFQDPWGLWINLTPVNDAELRKPERRVVGESRVDRHLWQELKREVRPNKLGHLLMFTDDWENTEAYYSKALGLRTSDRAVGKVSFMAGGTGVRDHHCFGLIKSTHRGFQHSSFHVDTVDEIGFGALQMHKAGFKDGFGVGRHALASNLFFYVRDPWGSWVEYYTDMDQISESWVAGDWSELPYVWPAWAPEFWTKEMNANLEPC